MSNFGNPHAGVPQRRHADGWMFLLEAARDMRTTGAVAPSSRALARALTEPVRAQAGRALNILEAGAGTGAVTRTLMSQLAVGSHLDVAEANPRFAARLRHLAGQAERVRIHTGRVEDLDTYRRYDVIVSGLPFANFDPREVETIMERYLQLLHPGGTLTYFAYRGARTTRALLTSRSQPLRRRTVEAILSGYQRRYATGSRTVWANFPPARVWQLTRPMPAASSLRHAVAAVDR